MIENRPEAVSVARCAPREMQRATIAEYRATGRATPTQRAGLKGLALQALSRNGERNGSATVVEKARNDDATPDCISATAVSTKNADLRARLLAVADAEGIAAELVRSLPDADVAACCGLPKQILLAYVRALADGVLRRRGRVPADETATAFCRGCGPVWVAPEIAAAAPVVDGMPRMLGCPWCHVRHAGLFVPRPQVECDSCQHFERDSINPAGGLGRCCARLNPDPLPCPHAKRQCANWRKATS